MSVAARATQPQVERFEALYEASPDPWRYRTSSYERRKYADTLAALPDDALGPSLDVGCSIGVFTRQLAARSESVLGLDFSTRAVAIARERLRGVENVRLHVGQFPHDAPDGPWDVIVCSEILYYLDPEELASAIAWLSTQLTAGSCVLAVSWRGVGIDEPLRGDDVHDALRRELGPWHAYDGRRPCYRLDRFDGGGS